MEQAHDRTPVRVLAYCLMPNHWHMLLWPAKDGDLSEFMRWLTVTHAQRWHAYRGTSGVGHVYQGRFKSFPVQTDAHFLTVAAYVERNAFRAKLVERAQDWRWCSLWRRSGPNRDPRGLLSDWPVDRPRNWSTYVNRPDPPQQLAALRECVARGRPFGHDRWQARASKRLGLESTLRPRGRPRKSPAPGATPRSAADGGSPQHPSKSVKKVSDRLF